MGNATSEDGLQVGHPSVLVDHGIYKMWYFEVATSWYCQIAYATSLDGRNWTKHGAVLSPTLPDEGHNAAYPSVVRVNGTYWMFYDGTSEIDGTGYRIFAATSPDGMTWTKRGVVLDLGPLYAQDSVALVYPHVLYANDTFHLWYTGRSSQSPPRNEAIMFAESANGLAWTKRGVVLSGGASGSLDAYDAEAGSVALNGSTLVMVYVGESAYLTSHLLYAVSVDGVHWEKEGLALDREPPEETLIGQPDLVIPSSGPWDLYYGVRNYSSDLQIYLATSVGSSPPTNVTLSPGGSLTSPVPVGPAGWAAAATVAAITGLGALVGVGIAAVLARIGFRRGR